jgi:hypothetical protein
LQRVAAYRNLVENKTPEEKFRKITKVVETCRKNLQRYSSLLGRLIDSAKFCRLPTTPFHHWNVVGDTRQNLPFSEPTTLLPSFRETEWWVPKSLECAVAKTRTSGTHCLVSLLRGKRGRECRDRAKPRTSVSRCDTRKCWAAPPCPELCPALPTGGKRGGQSPGPERDLWWAGACYRENQGSKLKNAKVRS